MKTLYPSLQKISAFLIAFIICGAVNAQDKDYAANTKQRTSFSLNDCFESVEPVVKVRSRTDKKIVLNWAPFKGGVSHYILERSTDGRSFQEVGLLFTGDDSEEPVYVFTDKLRSSYAGPLFYRLRVAGLDGSEIYTPVTIMNAERQ